MKLSVLICTYNGEKYIKEQLESVLNQSRPIDEIVVSDDNSSDNTVGLVRSIFENVGFNNYPKLQD